MERRIRRAYRPNGLFTAGIGRYTAPTKANGEAWKMVVPKSYMTHGKYMVQLVDIVPGQSAPHYIKFTFTY
jgi:hypothetical protein